MTEPRARSIKRWILGGAIGAGALGLLGGGTWIVYSAYTKLATTLHEVQREALGCVAALKIEQVRLDN